MKKLRRWFIQLLRPTPEEFFGETYYSMLERHYKEVKAFQDQCNHEQVSFDYPRLVICKRCWKPIRNTTEDEDAELVVKRLNKLNKEIQR